MTRYFKLCYFSNAMTRFPESPVCLAYLLALQDGCDPPENFKSVRGHIEGGKGPSDGQKIWARWFRDAPQYIPAGVLTPRQQHDVRATIGRFQDAFGAPFVSKTQRNCGRILALAEIFPEAVFLRVHRDAFDMVRSRWAIYKTRTDENRLWHSYRPTNAAEILAEDPIEHLCQQVVFTEADIDHDRRLLGSRGFFDISYEAFCRRPVETLESFAGFYRDGGKGALAKRHDIPGSFTSGHTSEIAPDEAAEIRRYLERHRDITAVEKAGSRA
jgi:hypothetical protein